MENLDTTTLCHCCDSDTEDLGMLLEKAYGRIQVLELQNEMLTMLVNMLERQPKEYSATGGNDLP